MGEDGFKAVVQSLASKDDKSDAGKLVAASAYTTDAFKSVKSAMGEDGFKAVVQSLASTNPSKAISIIKSMTRKKENFEIIKEILGESHFHDLPVKDVKSILKSVDARSFKTFQAVASAFSESQYTEAFKDESLQKKHATNLKKMEEESKKRKNTSTSSDPKRRRVESEQQPVGIEPIAVDYSKNGLPERSRSPLFSEEQYTALEALTQDSLSDAPAPLNAATVMLGTNNTFLAPVVVNVYNQPNYHAQNELEPRSIDPNVERSPMQQRIASRAIDPNNFRNGNRTGFERR